MLSLSQHNISKQIISLERRQLLLLIDLLFCLNGHLLSMLFSLHKLIVCVDDLLCPHLLIVYNRWLLIIASSNKITRILAFVDPVCCLIIRVWSHIQERSGYDLATGRKLVLLMYRFSLLLRKYLRLTVVGTSIRGIAWLTIAIGFFNVWAGQSIVVAHRKQVVIRLLARA